MRKGRIELRHVQGLGWRPQRHSIHLGLVTWPEVAFMAAAVVVAAYLVGESNQGGKNRAGQTIVAHSGTVRSVVFRPDSTMLLSLGVDGSAILRNLVVNQEYPLLAKNIGQVRSAVFSLDSRILVTLNLTGAVTVHDLTTHSSRVLCNPRTATDSALCLAFAPDNTTLAVGQQNGQIVLWDIGTGQSRQALSGHTGFIASLTFSPDGAALAYSSGDRSVRLWILRDGQERFLFHDQTSTVSVLAFSPDGRLLIMGNYVSPVIRLWDMTTGRERTTLQDLAGNLSGVALSHDGLTLAVANYNGLITFWDLNTFKVAARQLRHAGVRSLAFAPDGHTLATGGFDGTIRLWDWPDCALTNDSRPVAASVLPIDLIRISDTSVQAGTREANRPAASVQAAVSRGS